MSGEKFFSLEAITGQLVKGQVKNPEARRRDFRKALQITGLSVLSAIIVTVVFFFLEF